ncbi:MAG: hypothetical protein ABL933_06060 [Methyloglobulus sp.]|nr:nucleotidyltransferase domain-containing protein [Methyloglobulus sp.]
MAQHKPQPIQSLVNLKNRLDYFFKKPSRDLKKRSILTPDLFDTFSTETTIDSPGKNIAEFLNFMTDVLPDGDVYLFGGLLRDMALIGKSGFNSDIDIVVEGNWYNCISYLESLGAQKNKFGGYRLEVAKWPVDIWNAEETWAIKQGLVSYNGIGSLTETTVLNWDAILMNWRTKNFVCQSNYLESIKSRVLDIVLEENPNPLGMLVRVLRHLYLKDATKITPSAAIYLANCTEHFTFDEIRNSENQSYGYSLIKQDIYRFFEYLKANEDLEIRHGFSVASDILKKEYELH